MEWLGEALGLAGTLFGFWQRQKAKKAKQEQERLARELEAIRKLAGTDR